MWIRLEGLLPDDGLDTEAIHLAPIAPFITIFPLQVPLFYIIAIYSIL